VETDKGFSEEVVRDDGRKENWVYDKRNCMPR
jgi:hypothetical protein